MPRPGPRRPAASFRLDANHLEWLAFKADQRRTSQGDVVRGLITEAMTDDPITPPRGRPLIDVLKP